MEPYRQILKQQDWDELFPRGLYEQYQKDKSQLRGEDQALIAGHSLKFLIAHNNPATSILPYIQSLKAKKSAQFTSVATNHKLTVLIIAIMKNRVDLLPPLIDAGSDPKAQDAYGWTALHHAVCITSKVAFDLLWPLRDPARATNVGGMWQDIRRMVGLPIAGDPPENQLVYRELDGKEAPLTPEEIERRTGLKMYRNEVLYPDESLKDLWMSEPEKEILGSLLPAPIQKFMEAPPKLILALSSLPASIEKRFGVLAGEYLNKATILCQYVGKVVPKASKQFFIEAFRSRHHPYQLEELDAEEVGNISRFFNDGFPNVILSEACNCWGRRKRGFLITFEPIKEGDELTWDYGSSDRPLKWGKYTLLHCDKMRAFFKENGVEMLLNTAYLSYVFNTPAALIDLTLTGIVNPQDWYLIKKGNIFKEMYTNHPVNLHITIGLIHLLVRFNKALAPHRLALSEEISKFFESLFGVLTMFQIVEGIYDATRWLEDLLREGDLKQLWAVKKSHLQERLPSYNWIEDNKFVLYDRMIKESVLSQDLVNMV